MNTIEMAKQANIDCITDTDKSGQVTYMEFSCDLGGLEKFAALIEAAARADERRFIAEKWENWYGYDKEGVAEFIRKRANTQEET